MKDSFERKITYLRLSVTDLCNYRCIYCMPSEGVCKRGHGDILSIEELIEIGRAAVRCGVEKIRITGGEPLVRKGIISLVEGLAAIPGLKDLAMTTNGSLLPGMAKELKSAGLMRLNISLDTLLPGRFAQISRRGRLDSVLSGLRAAEDAGFTGTKLNCVLLGGINDDEIRSLAELSLEKALSLRFIELMPIGECSNWERERFVPVDAVLEALPELEPVGQDGVASLYRLPGAKGTVGLISPISSCFCPQCNRLRVTADGKLKPCLHSDTETELRGLSGDALEQAIIRAAMLKPLRHNLSVGEPSQSHREMYRIGG